MPSCPSELSDDARAAWESLSGFVAPGVLTVDNRQTLARYCHNLVRWWRLARWLDENEDTYEITDAQKNKRVVRHPNVITYEKLGHDLLRAEQEIGLTPASRSRIRVTKDEKPKSKGRFFPDGPAVKLA